MHGREARETRDEGVVPPLGTDDRVRNVQHILLRASHHINRGDPPSPSKGPQTHLSHPFHLNSARMNQTNHTSLIKLENVADADGAKFYLGKKLCYVYKAKTKKKGTVYRTSWGKVTRSHGTSGVVRAKFKNNLPPCSMGGKIRCMLYPSTV